MDKYRADDHKLMYHPDRVNDWLSGENIYPIYAEISPTTLCNHKCIFCALDFVDHTPKFLDSKILTDRLYEMGKLGVKAIMYAGEGEPLLHKDINNIILSTKDAGIDVAITTNGVLLNKELVDNTLKRISWIKVSIDAGTKERHSDIHKTNIKDFDRILDNLRYTVKVRNDNNYKTTIGAQFLLLDENCHEIELLATILKDIGVDYLIVKPYTQNPLSHNTKYKDIKYDKYLYLSDSLKKFNDDKFNVIFRDNTMKIHDKEIRSYKKCLALPFWSYIDSAGNVYGCSNYLGNDKFLYGNINNSSFENIWYSDNRYESLRYVDEELDVSQCKLICRMDKINEYLWGLKHGVEHVNFI